MKILSVTRSLLMCSAFFLLPAMAKELSAADREAALESLEKLNEGFESKSSGKVAPAIAAYRAAMSSDEAATDFYLKCVEKVEFTDLKRKSSDFREWRQNGCPQLSVPGFGTALRHQLRWLTLTLTASSSRVDRAKLGVEAQEAMDALTADFTKLVDHQQLLNSPVTGSIFARAFEFQRLNVPNWPLAPLDLQGIYDGVILDACRKAASPTRLQEGWTKYIQQVTAQAAAAAVRKKGGPPSDTQVAQQQKFLEQEIPELRWRMEVDLFKVGEEEAAATRMMEHLQKHAGHSSWPGWAREFKRLMKPEAPAQKTGPKVPTLKDFEE